MQQQFSQTEYWKLCGNVLANCFCVVHTHQLVFINISWQNLDFSLSFERRLLIVDADFLFKQYILTYYARMFETNYFYNIHEIRVILENRIRSSCLISRPRSKSHGFAVSAYKPSRQSLLFNIGVNNYVRQII